MESKCWPFIACFSDIHYKKYKYITRNFFIHNFRCVSDELCNGDVNHLNTNPKDICLSTLYDVDTIVEHLNNSLGDGSAEKSRYC